MYTSGVRGYAGIPGGYASIPVGMVVYRGVCLLTRGYDSINRGYVGMRKVYVCITPYARKDGALVILAYRQVCRPCASTAAHLYAHNTLVCRHTSGI